MPERPPAAPLLSAGEVSRIGDVANVSPRKGLRPSVWFHVCELTPKCARFAYRVVVQVEGNLRRIPLSRRSHVTGFQALATGVAEHESALERDFVTLTSWLDAGAAITSQPVTLRFEHAGERRRYTPDFHVRWSDGRAALVEVKYRADLREQWARLRPAFAVARDWASEHDASCRIATERAIRGPRLEVAKRLLPLRSAPVDAALADQAVEVAATRPTFRSLVDALPTTQEASLGIVWRLIARGRIGVDLAEPITPASIVWPS